MGGTNYYIESLLWDILVSPCSDDELKDAAGKYDADNDDDDALTANVAGETTSDDTHATVSGNLENVCIPALRFLLLKEILLSFLFRLFFSFSLLFVVWKFTKKYLIFLLVLFCLSF